MQSEIEYVLSTNRNKRFKVSYEMTSRQKNNKGALYHGKSLAFIDIKQNPSSNVVSAEFMKIQGGINNPG